MKVTGKISIKYANMSNRLFVKKQIHRILTWFFSYDKLTKLKTVSKNLFNNKFDEVVVNLYFIHAIFLT